MGGTHNEIGDCCEDVVEKVEQTLRSAYSVRPPRSQETPLFENRPRKCVVLRVLL